MHDEIARAGEPVDNPKMSGKLMCPAIGRRQVILEPFQTPEQLIEYLGWIKPPNFDESMARFRAMGLNDVMLAWLIAVASSKDGCHPADKFRYFCGCCWVQLRIMGLAD